MRSVDEQQDIFHYSCSYSSLSTTIRRQKLAGFVATPSPRRRQPAHAATSVTESVPHISDCTVIYASTIVHPQLASTASSSTSTDSYKQASKAVIAFKSRQDCIHCIRRCLCCCTFIARSNSSALIKCHLAVTRGRDGVLCRGESVAHRPSVFLVHAIFSKSKKPQKLIVDIRQDTSNWH